MARYNLNTNERAILTSWLFEVEGYLDAAVNNTGLSARNALLATPGLDVTAWIRSNTMGASTDPDNWVQCGMVWWMRAKDGVNVVKNQLPPETATWITILQLWDQSIADAFVRVSEVARNAATVQITAEDGSTSTMPAGTQLVQQRSLFSKVLPVLQQ